MTEPILGHYLKAVFMLITMSQPQLYISFVCQVAIIFDSGYTEKELYRTDKYYARYLGIGMSYKAGICIIVISMNGAFQ